MILCRADAQWSQTEKTNKSAIQEQKVKCAYLPAEDGTTNANGIPEESEDQTMNGDQSRMMDESVSSFRNQIIALDPIISLLYLFVERRAHRVPASRKLRFPPRRPVTLDDRSGQRGRSLLVPEWRSDVLGGRVREGP